MASSSYSPNEPPDTIIQEKTWFQGVLLSNLLFGVETTICVLALLAVFRKRTPDHARMRVILLVYITVLFAITAAAQGLMIDWIQMGFITQRNYPGGPSGFLNNGWTIPANLGANVMIVFANWMMESLFVWRCHVVCSAAGRLWRLGVGVPLLLLVAVFVSGIVFLYQTLHTVPSTSCYLAYGGSSLALNVTATGFIAGRLLLYRHRVVSRLGRGHGHQYVGIAMVVVESAVVYTCVLLVVIITYAVGSPATNVLQQVIVQVQAITSLLIIWRVARGEGWTGSNGGEVVVSLPRPRFGPSPQHNVIQLEVVSAQPSDEERIMRGKGDESEVSFPMDGDV